MLRLSKRNLRSAAAITLAATMFAGTVATAAPALAANGPLNRREVISRAKTWTSKKVPYNQAAWKNGYRTDCSGFVSMAWNLPVNVVTWQVPLIAKKISKSQLQPGDVLLNTTGDRHVVMFEKWTNSKHTAYYVLEESGQVNRAIRRKVQYPYWFQGSEYHPYRFVNADGYFKGVPKPDRQMVAGYKQDPSVLKHAPKPATRPAPKTAPDTTTPQSSKHEPTETPRPDTDGPAPSVPQAAMPSVMTTLFGWLIGH